MKRRAPRPLSEATGDLVTKFAPETLIAEVQSCWPSVVGERIASESQPISEVGGVLRVECPKAVWAHELELMTAQIVEKLNRRLKSGEITQIRFSTGSGRAA